jgi:hypothetical protein
MTRREPVLVQATAGNFESIAHTAPDRFTFEPSVADL